MYLRLFILSLLVSVCAAPALAQAPAPPGTAPVQTAQPVLDLFKKAASWRWEQISRDHIRYTGQAEIEGDSVRFFADQIDVYTDTSRLEATGNVVFAGPEGRISAERVEFDLTDSTGIFHQASGIMSLGPTADRAPFGGQDPDVLFYGEQIEKLGDRRYRLTRGGFTTCVQPTPRWEVTSGKVTINLNEYAIARNTVLRVKGVPVLYLPVIYYPIRSDERATGFLLPTYGTSLVRGQAISNAFFWAVSRSQDATFFHDWFTRTGQGVGAEYRYIASAQSSGNARIYRFAQRETTFTQSGVERILPQSTSYQVTANALQTIGSNVRARARVDYFTDIVTQQLYDQNVYRATTPYRTIDLGISAGTGRLTASAQYLRSEIFSNAAASSSVYGNTPRVTASLAPQSLFGSQVYASMNGEYAYLPYRSLNKGVVVSDNSLARADLLPSLRVPLSRLTFLSVNTTAGFRTTTYSRSLNAKGTLVDEPLMRQYFSVRTDVIGPVFSKIWDTPESAATERMKHVIEPAFNVDYVTSISNRILIPTTSGISDAIVGGAARFTYGITNRFFYRARGENGLRGITREFVTLGVQQTYYSDSLSSRSDTSYVSASGRSKGIDYSPLALTARVSPTAALDATTRLEYDIYGGGLQVLTSGVAVNTLRAGASMNYSRQHINKAIEPSSYLSANSSLRLFQSRVTGTYNLSWNISQGYVQSQSIIGTYMAQCCGVQFDFQKVNYPVGIVIPSDRRFNFSFVLAGLGTFSNFFGAFGQR